MIASLTLLIALGVLVILGLMDGMVGDLVVLTFVVGLWGRLHPDTTQVGLKPT